MNADLLSPYFYALIFLLSTTSFSLSSTLALSFSLILSLSLSLSLYFHVVQYQDGTKVLRTALSLSLYLLFLFLPDLFVSLPQRRNKTRERKKERRGRISFQKLAPCLEQIFIESCKLKFDRERTTQTLFLSFSFLLSILLLLSPFFFLFHFSTCSLEEDDEGEKILEEEKKMERG